MLHRNSLVAFVLLSSCLVGAGKDKKQALLPKDILQARTVLVVIDPDAGLDAQDPLANRNARQDVEKAFMKWGRFDLATDASTADLVVTVRKGNGKFAQGTIAGTPVNGNPPVVGESTSTPTGSTTRGAVRWGNSSVPGDPSNTQSPSNPHPQTEIGQSQDAFLVYRGTKFDGNVLDGPPVWRYVAKNGLEAPEVPAVDAFRKAIAESEKQLASATP